MYTLIIKPLAEQDLTEAANWYNALSDTLGNDFLAAVDDKIKAIRNNPFQFQVVHNNVRCAFTKRFPFGIFYIEGYEVIHVLAVQHTSKNPDKWKARR